MMKQLAFDYSAPYQRHSQTSRAAALAILPKQGTKRAIVLDFITSRGPLGATDEEGSNALRMNPSTYRPRRIELVRMGLVVDAGDRRTLSGQQAVVWVARS